MFFDSNALGPITDTLITDYFLEQSATDSVTSSQGLSSSSSSASKGLLAQCKVRSHSAWRGAAFGACPAALANFRLDANTAEARENGRLPRTTERDTFTRGFRFAYTRLIQLHHAGLFAGAACFHTSSPD